MRANGRHHQQGLNAAHHGSHSLPREPRISIINRAQCSSSQKPLTDLRTKNSCHQQGPNAAHHRSHSQTRGPRTGIVSRDHMQVTTETTHQLESRGQATSSGSKWSSPWKPLTDWKAKDGHHYQGANAAHYESHSLPEEPRAGIINRVKMQLTTQATHQLETQEHAS